MPVTAVMNSLLSPGSVVSPHGAGSSSHRSYASKGIKQNFPVEDLKKSLKQGRIEKAFIPPQIPRFKT